MIFHFAPRRPFPRASLHHALLTLFTILTASSPASRAALEPGEILLGEMNCVACHEASPAVTARLASRQGPRLGPEGVRLSPQWVSDYLLHPPTGKSAAGMPDMLHALPAAEKAAAAEALTHYLASLQNASPAVPAFSPDLAATGRELFHSVGCVACHAPQELPVSENPHTKAELDALAAGSAPLENLEKKFALDDLTGFLLDPLKTRPSGRMPAQRLTPEEARAIATYLLRDQAGPSSESIVGPGVTYEFYTGSFLSLPVFDGLKPVSAGRCATFSLSAGPQQNQMALRFRGLLRVPRTGDYTFWTASDDGSRLVIDQRIVVDNDGAHSRLERQGKVNLTAGDHAITVTYFDSGGGRELRVSWAGPGFRKQDIPASALFSAGGVPMRVVGGGPFPVDKLKAEQGRKLYARFDCGACHGLDAPATKARPLDQLTAAGPGCLAAQPPPAAPAYALNSDQRKELLALVANAARLAQPLSAADQVVRTLTVLDCYACHTRDGRGLDAGLRREYFKAKGNADLGEEGAIPPHLNGTGAKLKPAWLKQVLFTGASVRPYMVTRMPQFGEANVKDLVTAFEQADASQRNGAEIPVNPASAKNGQRLVSTEGLSCISCHVFAGHPSLGVPAMDLTTVPERLNSEWFRRYLSDPASLRPGTRMPSFWPDGVGANKTILNGDREKQISAIWSYLDAGKAAALPVGLIPARHELVAKDEPVIYRNFIQGAGPRGIAVGYPEKLDLVFDAGDMRLALLWQGPFIDAARHWTGRGEGFEKPLGYDVINLPPGAPFALLPDAKAPWPAEMGKAAGYQFRGYNYDHQRRPTFRYDFKGVAVEEFFLPVEVTPGSTDMSFRRTLSLRTAGPVPGLWFRAAVGDKIESQGAGAFLVDGKLRLAFHDLEPTIRQRGGCFELLVPVGFRNNAAQIIEDLSW